MLSHVLIFAQDDVVSKPFRIPELIAQIEKLEIVLGDRMSRVDE
jgi:DNA-binding response OmpR family regulator